MGLVGEFPPPQLDHVLNIYHRATMISDMLLLFFVFFLKRWLQARPCIWESGVVGKKSMALVYENSSRYSWIIYAVLELSHWPHFKIRFCCESNLLRSRLITCQSHGWIPGVVFLLYVRISWDVGGENEWEIPLQNQCHSESGWWLLCYIGTTAERQH